MKALLTLIVGLFATLTFAKDKAPELIIMKKSRCTTCHAVDKDKIGPSYKEVAKRYANPSKEVTAYLGGKSIADYLFAKVRKGSKRKTKNWKKSKKGKSFGIMTPNKPSKISDEDLKKVIQYILKLK